ncbi:hypothetical protein V7S43_009640 [Phytophthora oleae]|uniref:Uncharacterized protein n=1 Tax=Phytophthora oleae TaxID=2107226 RepID=A0ABD3FIR9_9STRA
MLYNTQASDAMRCRIASHSQPSDTFLFKRIIFDPEATRNDALDQKPALHLVGFEITNSTPSRLLSEALSNTAHARNKSSARTRECNRKEHDGLHWAKGGGHALVVQHLGDPNISSNIARV